MALLNHNSKALLIRECGSIEIEGTTQHVNDVQDVVEVLDAFLAFPVNDERVSGLAQKVAHAISSAATDSLNLDILSTSVSQLATAFEPFLKKLGFLKFQGDIQRVYGDATYVGLMDSTLGKLLEGRLARRPQCGGQVPLLPAPLVSFSYSPTGAVEKVHFETREIRNRVHESAPPTLAAAARELKNVLMSYCFALEENLAVIRSVVDPLFANLLALRNKLRQKVLTYVDNHGNEWSTTHTTAIDNLFAVEWQDAMAGAGSGQHGTDADSPLSASVRQIARQRARFWLTGEPGSGKSPK